MKCPYCQSEMNEGYIRTTKEKLNWTPKEKGANFWTFSTRKYQVQLGDYDIIMGAKTNAFYCNDCNKVIIDLNNNINDLD